MGRPTEDVETRFWRYVSPEPTSGCWLWTGALHGLGYPAFFIGGKLIGGHRYALSKATGSNRPGIQACHRCDMPSCVNPAHLFWGTALENKADSIAKGRHARGATNSNSKLTPDAVRAIRASTEPQRALAAAYGVTQRVIVQVKHRLTWKEVA